LTGRERTAPGVSHTPGARVLGMLWARRAPGDLEPIERFAEIVRSQVLESAPPR